MATYEKKNNAVGAVNDNPLAVAAVTLNLQSGQGANFPSSGVFLITVWDSTSYPNPGNDPNMEIIRVTSRSSDALTIVRAIESTSDVEHAQGQRVEMLITAGFFNDPTYGLEANLGLVSYVDAEVPTGSINGSNKTFTLANTPDPATSLVVFVNGIRQKLTTHYALSGLTLTTVRAYPVGTDMIVQYRY